MFACRKKASIVLLNYVVALSNAIGVYKADITENPGSDSGVTGTVIAFTPDAIKTNTVDYAISYGGFVSGVEKNCKGCGVHFHVGKSCEDTTAQGGHYFADPVMIDPWNEDTVYDSDENGDAEFHGLVKMGTDDVFGRTFLIHAQDGSRIGCGIFEKVDPSDTLISDVKEFDGSGVSGSFAAYQVDSSDKICYYGASSGHEANLTTFSGTHIHSGESCESKEAQEGHYYDNENLIMDPWDELGYASTDADGKAEYTACLKTGVADYVGKTWLVHKPGGGRVACGVLKKPIEDTTKPEEPEEPKDEESSANTLRSQVFVTQVIGIIMLSLNVFA